MTTAIIASYPIFLFLKSINICSPHHPASSGGTQEPKAIFYTIHSWVALYNHWTFAESTFERLNYFWKGNPAWIRILSATGVGELLLKTLFHLASLAKHKAWSLCVVYSVGLRLGRPGFKSLLCHGAQLVCFGPITASQPELLLPRLLLLLLSHTSSNQATPLTSLALHLPSGFQSRWNVCLNSDNAFFFLGGG